MRRLKLLLVAEKVNLTTGKQSKMPSIAFRHWKTTRKRRLDGLVKAHKAVSGIGPEKVIASQQINQAFNVLLAGQFQGYCRDLHTECVRHILSALAPTAVLKPIIMDEMLRGRQMDRGNAQAASLGADFGRMGISFWDQVKAHHAAAEVWMTQLDNLNEWRNVIAHQNFGPSKVGGKTTLSIAQVKKWRTACMRLARTFDAVMHHHLILLTGHPPR